MNQYKYFLLINGDRHEAKPLNVRALEEEYKPMEEDRRNGFAAVFSGEIVFTDKEYHLLHELETSINHCKEVPLEIHQRCGGDYVLWRNAILRLVEGKWDLDNCTVSITPVLHDSYSCFDERADQETNLLQLPLNKAIAQHVRGVIKQTSYTLSAYKIDDPSQFGGVHPESLGWVCYEASGTAKYTSIYRGGSITEATYNFFYAREELAAAIKPGPGWIDIGGGKWARKPLLTNYRRVQLNNTQDNQGNNAPVRHFPTTGGDTRGLFTTDIIGVDLPGRFDNGLLLNEVIIYFASTYCSLPVKSDFLQINPENDFSVTYPTFPSGLTFHHLLFQKSDVKRPTDSGNATKAPYTFKKLISNLCTIYNLQWKIKGGQLIIEHVSFFPKVQTLDTTQGEYKKRLVRSRKYKYKNEDLPRYEVFKFMESGSADFAGLPIEYTGGCTNNKKESKEKLYPVDQITTDVEYCLLNADDKSKKVSDDGLVLMACTKGDDGKYYTLTVEPVLETQIHINNSLGWAFLHQHYHRHRRPQLQGYMNGRYQVFESAKPVKVRGSVVIDFCCTDSIDLTGTVVTDMGIAEIGSAAFRLYTNEMELELVYAAATPAVICLRPKTFAFVERQGEYFYFDTLFEAPGNYHTEIEVIYPNGTSQIIPAPLEESGGVQPQHFGPLQTGLYRFRKRVVCGTEDFSPWTEYISVDAAAAAPPAVNACEVALPKPGYIGRNKTKLTFRFPGIEIAEDIEFELTARSSIVAPFPMFSKMLLFNATDVIVDIMSAYNSMEQQKITILGPYSGEYKFQFRKSCGNGVYSPWSDVLTINI